MDPMTFAVAALISWGVNTMLAPEVRPICYVYETTIEGKQVAIPNFCDTVIVKHDSEDVFKVVSR